MTEFTPTATAEAMLALAKQVEQLTAEMTALKHYVAAIPDARTTPKQTFHNMLNRTKEPGQSALAQKRLDAAHQVIDVLDGLSGEYQAQRKLG